MRIPFVVSYSLRLTSIPLPYSSSDTLTYLDLSDLSVQRDPLQCAGKPAETNPLLLYPDAWHQAVLRQIGKDF